MAAPTIDDVNNEREALVLLIAELPKAEDQEQFDQILELITAQAAVLEATVKECSDQIDKTYNTPESQASEGANPKVEVVLTPEQRQRVFEVHGVDLPSVIISDPIDKELYSQLPFVKGFVPKGPRSLNLDWLLDLTDDDDDKRRFDLILFQNGNEYTYQEQNTDSV